MDKANIPNKSSHKYEDLIKLRKAKLEKMRKERELLQYEKLKRACQMAPDNSEEIRLKNEISEKAKQIDDLEINKIQSEINKLQDNAFKVPKLNMEFQTGGREISISSKILHLECSHVQITEFPPIHSPKYSKYTQTDHSRLYIRNEVSANNDFEEDELEYNDKVSPLRLRCKFTSFLPPGILSPGLPNVMDIAPALTPIDKENPFNYLKEKNKKMLEEKREQMLLSEDFHNSLKRVSLTMEKVISRNKNIYVDYTSNVKDDLNDNSKAVLKLTQIFNDHNITNNRCITSIDWSPNCADIIAAAYYKNHESPFDVGEDVIIWNLSSNTQTPEHIFECHSSVMSICFTKFNVNYIIGATYSGQIVLWDKRVKSSIPVRCTKLNYKGHTQPIYCLRVIGDDSSHNLISISSDGKLCSWNLDMLGFPLDVMQLQLKVSDDVIKPITVTCMDFPANGANNLILGGEDGCAYTAFRYGYDSCINNYYKKHEASITSISSHFNKTSFEFGNLFLTASIDSTIKLWSLENQKPLRTFKNNYDYTMDVAWSPIHPAVFVTGDGNGCLDLYNLNRNIEEPMISLNTKGQQAINRLKWNDNGDYIAVGTEMGELYVYNVAEDLANPVGGEWCRFNEVLKDINVNYEFESE